MSKTRMRRKNRLAKIRKAQQRIEGYLLVANETCNPALGSLYYLCYLAKMAA